MRHWSEASHQELHVKPLHSKRVMVWCRISAFSITGTYFFFQTTMAMQLLWHDWYVNIFNKFLFPQLDFMAVIMTQSGSNKMAWPSYTAQQSINTLRTVFGNSTISILETFLVGSFSQSVSFRFLFMWLPEEQSACNASSKFKQNKGSNYGRTWCYATGYAVAHNG
jgi:hypothetical protein